MHVYLSPAAFAGLVVSWLYLYINLGFARWNDIRAADPLAATDDLTLELAMTHMGVRRRWKALTVYWSFILIWPMWICLGFVLALQYKWFKS